MDISKLLVENKEIITSKTFLIQKHQTADGTKTKKAADIKKKHACTWPGCIKSFGRPSDLTRHYRIHTNDRPHQCPLSFCGKRFIQRSALTVHQRTHSGEKPYICQFPSCNKSFGDSSSLARHRRIHTQIRSFICTEANCSKSYTKKSHLTRHTRRNHIKPETSECGEAIRLGTFTPSVTTTVTTDDEYIEDNQDSSGYDSTIVKNNEEDKDVLRDQLSPAVVYSPTSSVNQHPNYWSTNLSCYSNDNSNIIYTSLPTVYQPTENGYYYHGHQGHYFF